jgi:hypothetical protein
MRGGRPPGGVTVREIGHVLDVNGARLTIGVDCDAVTLTGAGITLDAAARDLFARYYFDAEAEAEKWQQEHEVVEAEIWCALVDGCIRGPAGSHLFDHSCQTRAEAESHAP